MRLLKSLRGFFDKSVSMKPTLVAVACALLAGCIEPPPPTKTVTTSIAIAADGCAANVVPVAAEPNDKVSWTLDAMSNGFPSVEAFSVTFDAYNPTYCVNEAVVAKNNDITCTIKFDADPAPVCYTIATRSNGGTQTCRKQFVLQVGGMMEHSCPDA